MAISVEKPFEPINPGIAIRISPSIDVIMDKWSRVHNEQKMADPINNENMRILCNFMLDEQRKFNMNYKGEFKNWQIYSMPIIFSCCSKLQGIEINRELLINKIESPREWGFKDVIEETLINYESIFGYDIEQCMIDLVEDVAKSKLVEAINNEIYPIQPLLNVVKAGEGKIFFQLSI